MKVLVVKSCADCRHLNVAMYSNAHFCLKTNEKIRGDKIYKEVSKKCPLPDYHES